MTTKESDDKLHIRSMGKDKVDIIVPWFNDEPQYKWILRHPHPINLPCNFIWTARSIKSNSHWPPHREKFNRRISEGQSRSQRHT